MRTYYRSFLYALSGLGHAFGKERNLKFFGAVYVCSLLLGGILGIAMRDWQMVIFTGGVFLSVELLNTALERFTDAFDRHSTGMHASAIKATKDIAAGASLICAVAWAAMLIITFLPLLIARAG